MLTTQIYNSSPGFTLHTHILKFDLHTHCSILTCLLDISDCVRTIWTPTSLAKPFLLLICLTPGNSSTSNCLGWNWYHLWLYSFSHTAHSVSVKLSLLNLQNFLKPGTDIFSISTATTKFPIWISIITFKEISLLLPLLLCSIIYKLSKWSFFNASNSLSLFCSKS